MTEKEKRTLARILSKKQPAEVIDYLVNELWSKDGNPGVRHIERWLDENTFLKIIYHVN